MKNRAAHRFQSVAECNGGPLNRREMGDGSLSGLERSANLKRTTNMFGHGKTCVRSVTLKESALTEVDMENSFRDDAWKPCRKETSEKEDVAGDKTRNEAPRQQVEELPCKGCTKSLNATSAYPASKVWDPVSVANPFQTYVSRLNRRGRARDVFTDGCNRKRAIGAHPRAQRVAITKNWPSVNMTPLSSIPTTWPLSLAPVPVCKKVNSKKICEVDIKGQGLVQIFQAEGRFAGKIVERTGPFSKTVTIPLYCEGLRDPGEATKSLMHLPQSVLRRRVHILSDRARGVERFIFVGGLGLRGGGNKASSSRDTHRHQAAIRGSIPRSLTGGTLTRTDSSIIRRILVGRRYWSLEEIVKAYNEADDVQEKDGLTKVMRKVITIFHGMYVREVTDNRGAVVEEYLAMCRLDGSGDEHLLLLKDFFDSLRDKLCNDTLHSRYLMEAVEHTLQCVDAEVFADDPNCLLQLAQFLLDVFDPQRTSFTKEMFPVQCSSLHIVHQCLRILSDVGVGSWDPNRPEGLYAKFKNWSQRVIDATAYFPAKYQAMLVQQSLTFLQSSSRSVRVANNARRIADLAVGTVGICQAVRKAVLLDFDLGNAESTARALTRARENRIVREGQWYKCLQALDTLRFAAIEDPSVFGQFKDLISSLVLDERGSNQEKCKVLRFGVVEMLSRLAIHGKDDAVRCTSAETLAGLVEPRDKWDWSSDPDLFLEILDNLAELSFQGREPEQHKAQKAIERLASNTHNRLCKGVLSEWLEGKTVKERIKSISSVRTKTIDNKLFTQVWKSLEGELLQTSTEVRSPPKKHHCLFSPLVVRHFAGREREYTDLIEAFESSTEQTIVKAVVGPGGIGKSQLAAKVFESLKNTSNYVNDFWISSDSAEGLSAAFLQIAEYLELPTNPDIPKLIRHVLEVLRKSRSLFVFDDVTDLESIHEYLPLANGHVIITTKDSGARDWSRDTVRLNPFDKFEARDLAEKFGFDDRSHAKDLEELLDELPGYPLALTQFFSVMENDELCTPAEWLTEVRHYDATNREVEVMEKLSAKQDSGGTSGIIFMFNSSIQKISDEPGNLGSRSLDLLTKLALLDPNGVSIEWVYTWYKSDGPQSKTTTRRSVRLLERFSHVSWDREKNEIYMHAETQLLVRHLLLNNDSSIFGQYQKVEKKDTVTIGDTINILVDSIDPYISKWKTDRSNRERWTSLARNGSLLLDHCRHCKDIDVELKLLRHISQAYGEICMFQKSLLYAKRAFEICERLHGEADHPDVVECIKSYAIGLSRVGRHNDSLPFDKKALEMCERLHGKADHPDVVECIRIYAIGLEETGRDNDALPLKKKALEMCERLHGEADHPYVVTCIKSYAIGLTRVGRNNDALPLYKKALEMCERLHGEADHPDVVACIKSYALGLSRVGRENDALPFYKKALEMCERLHGKADHPNVVECVRIYAIGLGNTGRNNDALPLKKKALEMCERLHGDADHPDVVESIRIYAIGLEETGRYNDALPLKKKALEMCERLHGDADHPDVVESIKSYAIGLSGVGRDNDALSLYKKALEMCERLHGDADHPDVVACIKSYTFRLGETGRDNDALPLDKKALEMCERLHGDADHPDVVESIRTYAIRLGKTGRENDALPLKKKALEMCERLHGEADHPDVVECIRSYAIGLEETGRDNDALPLKKKALEMCERLHGEADHPYVVTCIKSYAIGLTRVGRNNDALPLYKKALEMCERLHGEADHPDVVACIKSYALGLSRVGRENDALPFYKKALEMCERLHGKADHPNVVECVRIYAIGLGNTGRNNDALPLKKKALEMCERLHGDADHPDVVESIRIYAIGLEETGRYNDALPLKKKALEMCERLHGDADHPDVVESIKSYAIGLSGVGRDNDALPLYKKALEMCERLHGDADHPDVVACIKSYTFRLGETGRDNDALPLDKKALEMCERLHGDADHPDVVESIRTYAIRLGKTGRENDALPLKKKALEMCERLHGEADHPDVVECIRSYAIGLEETGRDNDALPLKKKALEMCERLHGEADHPYVVTCIKSYAIVLSRVGRDNDALPLYKKALEMCERCYGDADHPDVVACIKSYAIGLERVGRDNDALPYWERARKMLEHVGDH